MKLRRLCWASIIAFGCALPGCRWDATSLGDLSCADEGARSSGRVCQGGVWVVDTCGDTCSPDAGGDLTVADFGSDLSNPDMTADAPGPDAVADMALPDAAADAMPDADDVGVDAEDIGPDVPDIPPPLWFDPQYSYRKTVEIPPGKAPATLTDFPLLIDIDDPDLEMHAAPDGSDLVFVADDNITVLPHEIEAYASGALRAWVRVPSVPPAGTSFYLYFANPNPPAGLPPSAVWSAGYEAVWHMDDDPSSEDLQDSAPGANHAVPDRLASNDRMTGRIGGALDFDGSASGGTNISTNGWTGITLEAWIRQSTSSNSNGRVLCVSRGDRTNDHVACLRTRNRGIEGQIWTDGAFGNDEALSGDFFAENAWTYVAMTWDATSGQIRLFGQGFPRGDAMAAGAAIDSTMARMTIGNTRVGDSGGINGGLDEVRVSSVRRSVEWLTAQYQNQSDPAAFSTVDTLEMAP